MKSACYNTTERRNLYPIPKLNRFSCLELPFGKIAQNRLVVPPMASSTADENGFATDTTVSHYSRLAEAGAGITFVEYTYVDKSGRSEANQLGLTTPEHGAAVSHVAKALKASGTIPGIQLTHAGGKSERALTGGRLMAPSNVIVPVKDQILGTPDAMSQDDIWLWHQSFVKAAKLAAEAGFEIIELHCAHGYGLNQWLSPFTNKRTDRYGGSVENRSRLLVEILQSIRKVLPETLLAIRLAGQDFIAGGLTREDSLAIANLALEAGLNIMDVSSGLGGWRRPGDRNGEGYLVGEAAFMQANLNIPVIGVGGIQSGGFIDQSLSNRSLSFAAVGRAILENPAKWRRDNMGYSDKMSHNEVAGPLRCHVL